ncbi:MAG TPA: universal stress protein [Gaiellaceae bacterium]|nr:universal stress protein [Gaiellaceae bacterium]
MFETIVWATDGSDLADRALPTVTELARVHGSRIVAVHANELLRGRYSGTPLLADEPDIRDKIEQQLTELKADGFEVELNVASGTEDVAALIARAAVNVDADLIVVGTHGHGGFKSAVLGSVARGLLHTATCPVLAIPPERETAGAAHAGEKATVA